MAKCKHCAEEIQEDAKICKHCGKKVKGERNNITRKQALWIMVGSIVGLIVVISLVSSGDGGTPGGDTSDAQRSNRETLSTGEVGIINNNDVSTNCEGNTIAGVTEEGFDAFTKAVVADDREGIDNLLFQRQIFLIDNCSSIRKIDTGGFLGSVAKVRLLEPKEGAMHTVGWVAYEFAIKEKVEQPQSEKTTETRPTTKDEGKTISNESSVPPPVEEVSVTTPSDGRDEIITILKANASSEWGTDYEMVQYELNNQIEAYDWVAQQAQYPNIMVNTKQEWGTDYEMVQYEYENQVEAYEWMVQQTAYPNIMSSARQEWGTDYEMVQYEYENQVGAYESL